MKEIGHIPIEELAKNSSEQTLLDVYTYGVQVGIQLGIAQAQRNLNEFLQKEQLKYTRSN